MKKEIQITTRPNTAQGEETPERLLQMGERLREERKRLALSATELADVLIWELGLVVAYENGARKVPAEYLRSFDAAGGDVEYVRTGRRARPAQLDVIVRVGPIFQRLIADYREALKLLDGDCEDVDADLISVAARAYMSRVIEQAKAKPVSLLPEDGQ